MNSFSFSIVLIAWVTCGFICKTLGDSISSGDTLSVPLVQKHTLTFVNDTIYDATSITDSLMHYEQPLCVDTVKSSKPGTADVQFVKLDKVYVDAVAEREFNSNQSLTIIKPEKWIDTRKNLADVIADIPGVQTRKYGGEGSLQTVSIRGVDGKEVQVFLDGVHLNSAMGGAVDLGLIELENVDEIKVYKGIVPSSYGGNSLGGVIAITSKKHLKGNASGIGVSFGAYGYRKATLQLNSSVKDGIRLFSAVSYTSSHNDWKYFDRNKTSVITSDDTIATVRNHEHQKIAISIIPSIELPNDKVLQLSASITSSATGIPGTEGSVNKTAKAKESIALFTLSSLDHRIDSLKKVSFTKKIGYGYTGNSVFYTSLDSSMGAAHGNMVMFHDSYCRLGSDLHNINMSIQSKIRILPGLTSDITASANYSKILTNTETNSIITGNDWPGSSQEVSLAGDADWNFQSGVFHPGAHISLAGKLSRSETDGGNNTVLSEVVKRSDEIDYPWSMAGGIYCGIAEYGRIFINGAKYMAVPSLRERYGFNGAVIPNPDLQNEDGNVFEAGLRFKKLRLKLESIFFMQSIKNGIVFHNDGKMSKPVNIGRTLTKGVELSSIYYPWQFLKLDISGTWQQARNVSTDYNQYGRLLPNEPDFTISGGTELSIHKRFTLNYSLEFKTVYYRDDGNVLRVPANEKEVGSLFHNVNMSIKVAKNITTGFSISNLTTDVIRYETLISGTQESNYSWTVFPQNEWNFYLRIKI
ncbi:MAG: TonB-dependent receptor [Fibrobacter sp.]|nr:TonB-dependent receptor [Fibrobacter sp.]